VVFQAAADRLSGEDRKPAQTLLAFEREMFLSRENR
jgi:hypothetical protein